MSSRYIEKNDDLTTDAMPSPPRDGTQKPRENSSDSDNKESHFEELNTGNSRTHTRKTKSRGFTKVKRISPPTAYASIININNSSDVHVGANIIYNLSNNPENTEKSDVVETNAIKILQSNPKPIDRSDLLFVATHVDERWRDIGRALNFSDGQIQQFFLDHKDYGIKEVIYQLLLDWSRNEQVKASIGQLASILWNQNQKDVVRRWSERQ